MERGEALGQLRGIVPGGGVGGGVWEVKEGEEDCRLALRAGSEGGKGGRLWAGRRVWA